MPKRVSAAQSSSNTRQVAVSVLPIQRHAAAVDIVSPPRLTVAAIQNERNSRARASVPPAIDATGAARAGVLASRSEAAINGEPAFINPLAG